MAPKGLLCRVTQHFGQLSLFGHFLDPRTVHYRSNARFFGIDFGSISSFCATFWSLETSIIARERALFRGCFWSQKGCNGRRTDGRTTLDELRFWAPLHNSPFGAITKSRWSLTFLQKQKCRFLLCEFATRITDKRATYPSSTKEAFTTLANLTGMI